MTRVIAVSESARDAMARYARFDSTMIGNGVDCDAFQAGPSDAAVRRRHDQHPERRPSRAAQRHRPDHRRLRAAGARSAGAAAAARRRGTRPRPQYEAQVRAAAGVDRVARRVSRARCGRSARISTRRRTASRSARARRASRFCCSRRWPPACASRRCRARARAAPASIGRWRRWRQSETPEAYAEALAARAGAGDARTCVAARPRDGAAPRLERRSCRGSARVYDEALARRDRLPGEEERREHGLTDREGDDQPVRARPRTRHRQPGEHRKHHRRESSQRHQPVTEQRRRDVADRRTVRRRRRAASSPARWRRATKASGSAFWIQPPEIDRRMTAPAAAHRSCAARPPGRRSTRCASPTASEVGAEAQHAEHRRCVPRDRARCSARSRRRSRPRHERDPRDRDRQQQPVRPDQPAEESRRPPIAANRRRSA